MVQICLLVFSQMLSRPRGQLGELGALQHCLAIGHSHLVLLDMHQEGLLVTVPLTTLGALEVALLQMDNAEMTLYIDPGWRLVGALLALWVVDIIDPSANHTLP